jgi:hypothetical protein
MQYNNLEAFLLFFFPSVLRFFPKAFVFPPATRSSRSASRVPSMKAATLRRQASCNYEHIVISDVWVVGVWGVRCGMWVVCVCVQDGSGGGHDVQQAAPCRGKGGRMHLKALFFVKFYAVMYM